jgi:hypothetical protein
MSLLITILELVGGYILIGLVVSISTLVFHRKSMEEELDKQLTPEMRALDASAETRNALRFGIWFGVIVSMTPQWPYIVCLTVYSAFKKDEKKGESK